MLSWSSNEQGIDIDLRGIVDDTVDTGVLAGRELVEVGRAAGSTVADRGPLEALAAEIGLPAALDAAAVAANFQIMNRVVNAVGLSVGRRQREQSGPIIEALGLQTFPHG